jgi:hypothetical protein
MAAGGALKTDSIMNSRWVRRWDPASQRDRRARRTSVGSSWPAGSEVTAVDSTSLNDGDDCGPLPRLQGCDRTTKLSCDSRSGFPRERVFDLFLGRGFVVAVREIAIAAGLSIAAVFTCLRLKK